MAATENPVEIQAAASGGPQQVEQWQMNFNVLLVEDNHADVVLTQQLLSEDLRSSYTVVTVDRLSQAKSELSHGTFDVVLLDLTLPDADQLEGVHQLLLDNPGLVIVVLTGYDDEVLGIRAIHLGAQDYLVKNRMNGDLLVRSLRFAVERATLQKRLEEANLKKIQDQEIFALNSIATEPSMGVVRRRFKSRPLKEVAPRVFHDLVANYEDLFDLAIKEQVYRLESKAAEKLRNLADRFCSFRVGPKDVIDVHLAVLDRKISGNPSHRQVKSITYEARIVLLQVLGFLAEGYRTYAIWTTSDRQDVDEE